MENGVEAGNERSDEMIESAWRELGFWAAGLVGGSMRLNVERVLFSPDFCLERLQQHNKLIVLLQRRREDRHKKSRDGKRKRPRKKAVDSTESLCMF